MIFIKHRFNVSSRHDANNFDALEIDVMDVGGNLHIGHDKPETRVTIEALRKPELWVHAKTVGAYKVLCKNRVRCFMHDKEPIARVEGGFFWTCIPEHVCNKTVFMETNGYKYSLSELLMIKTAYGICSDHPEIWKLIFGERK